MKVILIKDCKDGKVNDVVDVATGYATNFLIKNGYAVAMNSTTKGKLNRDVAANKEAADLKLANAEKAKAVIEATTLNFTLSQTNNVIHGSITRKQIIKQLLEKNIHVKSVDVENKKIDSMGISKVNIKLHNKVTAVLNVKVVENE